MNASQITKFVLLILFIEYFESFVSYNLIYRGGLVASHYLTIFYLIAKALLLTTFSYFLFVRPPRKAPEPMPAWGEGLSPANNPPPKPLLDWPATPPPESPVSSAPPGPH